jgi:hypothetical protein
MGTATAQTIWGIHVRKDLDADTLFLHRGVVALDGWKAMGDLSTIPGKRDAFKSAYSKAYPDAKPAAILINTGQPFRFLHEMKQGDLVVYPSKVDRKINIGQVTGDYFHDPKSKGYPNLRPVKWLTTVTRNHFSQGALHELGAQLCLFQIKTHADEFRAAVESEPEITKDALEQSTKTAIAEDAFDPSTLQDARERIAATIVRRRGQPEFRKTLLEAYGNRCAMTGCGCVDVLEAAHVYPYRGPDTNHVCNGLLLRSDLQTLFDLGLIGIDSEDFTIVVADSLRHTVYGKLAGKRVCLPANSAERPNRDLLKQHRRDSRLR